MTVPDRTGVLIVRAWVEADGALRARITCSLDVAQGPSVTRLAGSVGDVQEAVSEWLVELRSRPASGSAPA